MKKILRIQAVMNRTGLSRTTIWRLEQKVDSDFPSRRKIGPKAVGWIEEEIDEYITSREKVNEDESG